MADVKNTNSDNEVNFVIGKKLPGTGSGPRRDYRNFTREALSRALVGWVRSVVKSDHPTMNPAINCSERDQCAERRRFAAYADYEEVVSELVATT
jgi:hypothetical protein